MLTRAYHWVLFYASPIHPHILISNNVILFTYACLDIANYASLWNFRTEHFVRISFLLRASTHLQILYSFSIRIKHRVYSRKVGNLNTCIYFACTWWHTHPTAHTIWNILAATISWFCGPGSVVGIATGYGLDGPGIKCQWGRDFPHLSRPALGPTQPPV
jgi:hypothetical protein